MEFTGEVAVIGASGPAITALIAALRKVGLAENYTPLIAMLVGLLFSVVAIIFVPTPIISSIIAGLLAGASATGLHQAGRSVNREVRHKEPSDLPE